MPKVVPGYREEAKKRILDAASSEFAKNGYGDTTMDDIAKRIGVSKGAVYQYFQSKESLISAIGRLFLEKAIQIEYSPPKGESLIKITEGSFVRLLNSMPEWYPSLVCDVMSEAQRDGHTRELVTEIRTKLAEAMSVLWEERKKAGEIPKETDVARVAHGLSGLQLGLIIQISTGLPRAEAAEAWSGIVNAIAKGLASGK